MRSHARSQRSLEHTEATEKKDDNMNGFHLTLQPISLSASSAALREMPCLSSSKQLLKKIECDSTNIDQYSARNLRQRLSPKAKPWDSGNSDQWKRQACSSASLERVVMLIPSRDFLLSCESCESCQKISLRFSASLREIKVFMLLVFTPASYFSVTL
jgi:hypothetical protein